MEGAVTESIYAYRQCISVSKWERRKQKMGPGRKKQEENIRKNRRQVLVHEANGNRRRKKQQCFIVAELLTFWLDDHNYHQKKQYRSIGEMRVVEDLQKGILISLKTPVHFGF